MVIQYVLKLFAACPCNNYLALAYYYETFERYRLCLRHIVVNGVQEKKGHCYAQENRRYRERKNTLLSPLTLIHYNNHYRKIFPRLSLLLLFLHWKGDNQYPGHSLLLHEYFC